MCSPMNQPSALAWSKALKFCRMSWTWKQGGELQSSEIDIKTQRWMDRKNLVWYHYIADASAYDPCMEANDPYAIKNQLWVS